MEEALTIKKKTEALSEIRSRRKTSRAKGFASLGVVFLLLLGGGVTLFFFGNAFGAFLLVGGFLFLGAMTGLFEGSPSRSRMLNRARHREDERRRKREAVDN